uniref:BRCT domain-containing protein n=1 Tax=Meloidogyne floridensis TaxID=298350 RepID=A0A915NT36_9BILA
MNSYFDLEPTTDSRNYENNVEDHLDDSQKDLKQQNSEVNGKRNGEAVDDPIQKDPKPPFTPPSNFSSGIVTSANRRVSSCKRRSGILALTPTSVKRRRITNEGHGNTPVTTTPRSAKRRRSRAKNQINGTPLINFDDPEDPYNFFFKSNEHPTPLKDISVKRASFGESEKSPRNLLMDYNKEPTFRFTYDISDKSLSNLRTPSLIKRSEASLVDTPKAPHQKSLPRTRTITPRGKRPIYLGVSADDKPVTTDMHVLSAYGKEVEQLEDDNESKNLANRSSPRTRTTPRAKRPKLNLDGFTEDGLDVMSAYGKEVFQDDNKDKYPTNKPSPRIRSRSPLSNITTPQKQQTPRKSPRSAKKNETKEEEVDDYLETTGENVDVAINKENLEDLNDSHNISIIENNSTPQRKPSPFDAIEILSPVQEITELNKTGSYPSSAASVEDKLFADFKFVFTSANRPNKVHDFNKREYRTIIGERGGTVIEDFFDLKEGELVVLITDTFYRTHKYLSALSLSIPCLSCLWIQECVANRKLLKNEEFLLPAGESTSEPGRICQWKPLKGVLFNGKRVIVYNRYYNEDPNVVSFGEIWIPMMRNLGATVVGIENGEPFSKEVNKTVTLEAKLEFCRKTNFEFLLTENDCEPQLAGCVSAKNALAVSSEWVIQAMITGELPRVEECDCFRYDYMRE